jgi:hypothetical protein
VTTAGTAKIDVLGTLSSGSLPIAYYWINNTDNTDLGVAASTLNPMVAKTAITDTSFVVNLHAGINVICFKTVAYSGLIANGASLGLKVTAANGYTLANAGYTADAVSGNVAAVQKMKYLQNHNVTELATTETDGEIWSVFELFPYSDEAGTVYDGTLYPKILSYSVDLSNTSWIVPSTNYSNLDFTNTKGTAGQSFSLQLKDQNSILQVLFDNASSFFGSNNLSFQSTGGSQIVRSNIGNFAYVEVFTNVYNNGASQFGPAAVCWYHKSVHYVGNPETWVIDPSGNRIQ